MMRHKFSNIKKVFNVSDNSKNLYVCSFKMELSPDSQVYVNAVKVKEIKNLYAKKWIPKNDTEKKPVNYDKKMSRCMVRQFLKLTVGDDLLAKMSCGGTVGKTEFMAVPQYIRDAIECKS